MLAYAERKSATLNPGENVRPCFNCKNIAICQSVYIREIGKISVCLRNECQEDVAEVRGVKRFLEVLGEF